MMNQTRKKQGYTILEIILGVFAMSCIMLAIIPLYNYYNRTTKAQNIADETVNYAKIFVNYIINNDNLIRSYLTNSTDVYYITWNTINSSGYSPSGTISGTNLLGQSPCVAISRNTTTDQLTPYLFFVGGNSNTNYTILDANTAMNQIGAIAGIYSTSVTDPAVKRYGSGAFGIAGGWQVLASSNYISGISHGCGASLQSNSIVINISMMSEYNGFTTGTDLSLHRYFDESSSLGTSTNTNTLQTDISITESGASSSHKIYFSGNNENTGVYLWSNDAKNNVTLQNGSFVANSLQPTGITTAFTMCESGQLGTMMQQSESNLPMQSQLQCSYDALQCQGQDPHNNTLSGYCYLPVSSITITYKPNTSSFTCPEGYIDSSISPTLNIIDNTPDYNTMKTTYHYYNCTSGWYANSGRYYWCNTSKNDTKGCIVAYPSLVTTTSGKKQYQSYNIYNQISYSQSLTWVYTDPTSLYYGKQNSIPLCPEDINATRSVTISAITCTTANPTITYDYNE